MDAFKEGENYQFGNTRRAWSIWAICMLFCAFQLFVGMLFGISANSLSKSLHISASDISKLVSIYFLSYAVIQIPVGIILDKMSVRIAMIICSILMALGLILLAMTSSLLMAYIYSIMIGIGWR